MYPSSKKICGAFHKGPPNWKTYKKEEPTAKFSHWLLQRNMSKWIKFYTKGDYSHVEGWFPFTNDIPKKYQGHCFSASGYENRVRWKHINFTHKSRWTFVEIQIPYNVQKIMVFINHVEGWKYDYLAAMTCMSNEKIKEITDRKKRLYCSDCFLYFMDLHPKKRDPNSTYRYLLNEGIGKVIQND